jgi:hypothetical protein
VRGIPEALKEVSLTDEDKAFLAVIEKRIAATTWGSVVEQEVWQELSKLVPKFVYFGEYEILPSKMNLTDLSERVKRALNCAPGAGPVTCTLLGQTRSRYHAACPSILSG